MKNTGKKIGILIALLVVVYGIGAFYFSSNVIFNTSVYNEKVTKYDAKTIKGLLEKQDVKLIVKDDRKEITIPLKDLEFTIFNGDFIKQDIINQQNFWAWPLTLVSGANYEPAQLKVDEEGIDKWLDDNKVISNKGLPQSKDAYFDISDDGKVSVVKEVIGSQLDQELVKRTIVDELILGGLEVDLNKAIIMPNVMSSVLEGTLSEVEFKIANNIEIAVENKDYTIQPSTADKLKWLNIDYEKNEIYVEKKAIKGYLESINEEFIKKGGSTETIYKVAHGQSELIKKGQSVSGIDEYALTAKIYDAMENNYELKESAKAVSISKPKVVYEGHSSIDNNFIEVSISDQKVYLYSDGKLVLAADVVTGKPGGNTDTPKGKFSISYKTTHFTLKGDAYGYDYELPVDYWLPFEGGGGVGLHDAPWRANGSFGGSLYLSDGSHGCINMRHADVKEIYNTVVAGTAVWVH